MAKKSENIRLQIGGELLGLVITSIVLIIIAPKLPFVTSDYSLWLPIAVTTSIVSTFAKITGKALTGRWKYLGEIVALITGMYSTYYLLIIFPVNFTLIGLETLNSFFAPSLQIALVAMLFAIVVNIVKVFVFDQDSLQSTTARDEKND